MNKARHYRGGYDSAGLLEMVRELRKRQTSAERVMGSCFEIVKCSDDTQRVLEKIAKYLHAPAERAGGGQDSE